MKKKDNPKNYTKAGHALSCNNISCKLKETCFRTFYKSKKQIDWEEGGKCVNYIKFEK